MAEIKFLYESNEIKIQCNKGQKMRDICNNLSNKINTNINSLIFLYGGMNLNLDKTYNETTKENLINVLVYKIEEEICPKCGRLLNDKIIDEIFSLNNNINEKLIGIKSQIEHVINDINKKKDIKHIGSQLKNINLIISGFEADIKKINNYLTQIRINYNNNLDISTNETNIEKNKMNSIKNEIFCIYDKKKDKINLLHDYNAKIDKWTENVKKSYLEGKNNINEQNIEIYIDDEKIKFDYEYISKKKGEIIVIFKFNKLLTSTSSMFTGCSSLKKINLSSFNTSNNNDMRWMFSGCSNLESIDFSSIDTTNVKDMCGMFSGCSSLKSIDLSSFNTKNVNDISFIFSKCSSLKSVDLSSFNIPKTNNMFDGCSSLKKNKIKINNIDNIY
jgi:surface protein